MQQDIASLLAQCAAADSKEKLAAFVLDSHDAREALSPNDAAALRMAVITRQHENMRAAYPVREAA